MRRKLIAKLFVFTLVVVLLLAGLSLGVGCQQSSEVQWVDFTAAPTEGSPPLTVQFTSRSPADITEWWWFFGDGHSSTEPNPSHTYAADGYYTVSLIGIGNTDWKTCSKEDYIRVGNPVAPSLQLQPIYVNEVNVAPMIGSASTKLYILDYAGQGVLYWTNFRVMDRDTVDSEVPRMYEHSIWVDGVECYGALDAVYEIWEFQQEQLRRPDAFYPAIYHWDTDTSIFAFWRVNIPFQHSLVFALENNSDYGTIRVYEATLNYGTVVSGMSPRGVFGYGHEWKIDRINEDLGFPVAPQIKAAMEKEFGEKVFSVAIISVFSPDRPKKEEYFKVLCVDAPDITRGDIKRFISQDGFVEFPSTEAQAE